MAEKLEPSQIERIAFREAGYAVIAVRLGRAVRRVSIIAGEGSLELTKAQCSPHIACQARAVRTELMSLIAGGIAEAHFSGRQSRASVGFNHPRLIDPINDVCGGAEDAKLYLEGLREATASMIRQDINWHVISTVAAELLAKKVISGVRLRQVIAEASREFVRLSVLPDR